MGITPIPPKRPPPCAALSAAALSIHRPYQISAASIARKTTWVRRKVLITVGSRLHIRRASRIVQTGPISMIGASGSGNSDKGMSAIAMAM